MQHTPPSTYILRELVDVKPGDAVSWWPGFELLPTGWWYVIAMLSLISVVVLLITLRHIWKNRYRREALTALKAIMVNQQSPETANNQTAAEQHFYTLKQVLFYIDSDAAKLADNALLDRLDRLIKNNTWQNKFGQRWISSLYNPHVCLSSDEILHLNKQSQYWLRHHKNQSTFQPLQFLKGQ